VGENSGQDVTFIDAQGNESDYGVLNKTSTDPLTWTWFIEEVDMFSASTLAELKSLVRDEVFDMRDARVFRG